MNTRPLPLALLLPLGALAAELPPPVIPAGVGVNIHFVTGHEQDLDLIAEAGFKFIRMDFGWGGIEQKKNQYDWRDYEQLLEHLDKRGIRALFILDYSNPLYEETVSSLHPITHAPNKSTASPRHPESIAAFSKWAAAAAAHFRGRHVIWEIWNEPNGNFWSPKPDAAEYSALALSAARAVRAADPAATIIGPASSGFPWEFLETFLKSGVLQYLDGVSVHPYRESRKSPETAAADYDRLRKLIAKYAPAGKQNLPILSGEWGYSTHRRGVSPQTQAAFAVRQQLSNLLDGVPLSIWYDWKNDGEDPGENEHNFGTVTYDLQPKPAYTAMKTMTHQLSGCRIVKRVATGNEADYVLLCARPDANILAAWSTGQPHSVELSVSGTAQPVRGMKGEGTEFAPRMEPGKLTLDLEAAPQYVHLGRASVSGH